MNILRKKFSKKQAFLIICIIYLIGYYAIIRSNFLYIDDMGRSISGYRGWDNFSRWISFYGSYFFGFSNYLTDISPLSQIFAICLLALASIIIIFYIYKKAECTIFDILGSVIIGFFPYFLECISYHFDAPFMAMSVLFSLAPLVFKERKFYIPITIICIAGMSMTYQASSGIFPVAVVANVVFSLKDFSKDKLIDNLKFIFKSIIGYGAGLALFSLVFMNPVHAGSAYVSSDLAPLGDIIKQLGNYYTLFFNDFRNTWKVALAAVTVCYIITMFCTYKKKIAGIIASVAGILFFAIFAWGIYPALQNPLMASRAMYGPGIIIALMCCGISNFIVLPKSKKILTIKNLRFTLVIPLVLISYMFFSFSFTYGNALAIQKDFIEKRVTMVLEDLNHCEEILGDQHKEVQFVGSPGLAPGITNMATHYPIISRLVPVHISNGWDWGYTQVLGLNKIPNMNKASNDISKNGYPELVNTMLYTIKGDESHVVIYFK